MSKLYFEWRLNNSLSLFICVESRKWKCEAPENSLNCLLYFHLEQCPETYCIAVHLHFMLRTPRGQGLLRFAWYYISITQRLAVDSGGGRRGPTVPSLCHLLLSAQAVCPDPILSIKWTLARFSGASFSICTQWAHSPIQCVSLCVFCLNTVLPTPYCQHG